MSPDPRRGWTPAQADRYREHLSRLEALDDQTGVQLMGSVVVGRSVGAVVTLIDLRVYGTALTFYLSPVNLASENAGRPRPGRYPPLDRAKRSGVRPRAMPPLDGGLLVGIKFGDGRWASSPGSTTPAQAETSGPAQPVLHCFPPQNPRVFGPGFARHPGGLFAVYPVPPVGAVLLVVAAPALGIDRTVTVLDGNAMQDARLDFYLRPPPDGP